MQKNDSSPVNAEDINLNSIRSWLRKAGRIARKGGRPAAMSIKENGTIVTPFDLEVETYLLNQIRQCYPDHAILSEEYGSSRRDSDWLWVIDPIDGTRAYVSGLPIWGISIGVLHQNVPFMGGFYLPVTGEMVWGNCQRAYFNRWRLKPVSNVSSQSPIAFVAVPSNFHQSFTINFPRIRSLGSTAAHLALVARGIALAAVTRQVSLWDLAGLLPILKAVDIDMVYLSGNPFRVDETLDGKTLSEPLIAAPSAILEEVRNMIHAL